MMDLTFSKEEIAKYRDNSEIVRQTANQIIKDFALFGLTIDFPSDLKYAYPDLSEQLTAQIQILLDTNSSKILSLLYQIDIPEIVIQREASQSPERPLADVVTELIFLRELKKVLTRRYFSEKGL